MLLREAGLAADTFLSHCQHPFLSTQPTIV